MKNKILFLICLLVGLLFINGGLNKFFNYMPAPDNLPEGMIKAMQAFMTIGWLMPLVGAAEVIGGVLFIIPKTRALGAIVIFPLMVGILLTNTITDSSGAVIGIVLLAVNLWVIFEEREKYLPMVQ